MSGWTTPRTWSSLGTVPSAGLNTDLRDNLNWLKNQPSGGLHFSDTISNADNAFRIYGASCTEDWDSDDMVSGTLGGLLTIRTTGWYMFIGGIQTRVSGTVGVGFLDNATTWFGNTAHPVAGSDGDQGMAEYQAVSFRNIAVATHTVQLGGYHSGGGTFTGWLRGWRLPLT